MIQGAQGWRTRMTLEGWDGEGGGTGVSMENTGTSMADSWECMAKTTTIL